MSIKKGTPGKGGGPRPECFSYTGVAHGLKNAFNAWIAGDTYWAEEAHEHKKDDPGTKPCLHWLTDGAVRCPRCRKGRPVKCIGWVPIYRESDSLPRIVIVHESASDLLAGLKYPDYVLIGRIDGVSSVFVRKSGTPVPLKTEKECRKRPVDIVPDLLTMWGMPELNEWLKGQPRELSVSDSEVSPPVKDKPVKKWNRFVELGSVGSMSGAVTPEVPEIGTGDPDSDVEREFLRQVQEGKATSASANGKHKRPKNG